MNRALVVGAFFLLISASGSHAQNFPDYSGNDLLRDCTDKNSVSEAHCLGLVQGIWAGAVVAEVAHHIDNPLFVIPSSVDVEQLKDVAVKFLNEHPETRHLEAGILVIQAWKAAFPPKP